MSDEIAISVEGLGKCYRIHHRANRPKTLAEAVHAVAASPFKYLADRIRKPDETELFWALKDVSFEVKRGEVIGIIGRNGAGKSTLLKILSKITDPTEGRATIRGRVNSLLEVGTGFHPELSGRENIYMNAAMHGMKRAEINAKLDEIVGFAEVEQFIDTPVKRYSSGMYTRLAFAVAAHLEPEIMIVDEVLAVGDAAFQKKCLGKMSDVSKAGQTVLFVSHNMAAIQTLCGSAIWLEKGHVVERGDCMHVVGQYLQRGNIGSMERTWEDANQAPGDSVVRLRHVSIAPANDDDPKHMTVRTPVALEFLFENYVSDTELNLSIVLYNIEGVCIFNTGSGARRAPKGMLKGRFVIPADFLNDAVYSVRVLIVKDSSVILLDIHDVVTFEIHDIERGGAWYGKWIGAIRPTFEWKFGPERELEAIGSCV